MRPLQGPRRQHDVLVAVVFADVGEALATERRPQHLNLLGESRPAPRAVDFEAVELLGAIAVAETQRQAAAGQLIENRDLLGRAQRIAQRQQQGERREGDAASTPGDGGQHRQ